MGMCIRNLLTLLALTVCALGVLSHGHVSAGGREPTLIKDRASDYVIVLPADAIPAEMTAAKELRNHLRIAARAILRSCAKRIFPLALNGF